MGSYRIYITDRELGKLYPGLSEIFYWKLCESEQLQFIIVCDNNNIIDEVMDKIKASYRM